MKIAIAIMSAINSVSERNVNCQLDTFVNNIYAKKRNNEYKVYVYQAKRLGTNPGTRYSGRNFAYIDCDERDGILSTFEKTVYAYREILKDLDFDILIRCNISCYLNVNLLDSVIDDSYDRQMVLCNSINTVQDAGYYMNKMYPRGDFYIVSRENVEGALKYADDFINGTVKNSTLTHVDDVLFGMCLYEHTGIDGQLKLLTVKYGYHPEQTIDVKKEINPFCLAYRVKTVPPTETFSGYSWDDNEWRKYDVEKMKDIHGYLKDASYKGIKISSLIVNDGAAKPCVFYSMNSRQTTIYEMKKKLISGFI